jgi:ferredoxin
VYVEEVDCIGCKHCAHTAANTFYIEPEHGRARAFRQDGDPEDLIQEAIDTCPVNCIHWVDYTELKHKEAARKYQVIRPLGFPHEGAAARIAPHQEEDLY